MVKNVGIDLPVRHSSPFGINLQTQCCRSAGPSDKQVHRHRHGAQAEPDRRTVVLELLRQCVSAIPLALCLEVAFQDGPAYMMPGRLTAKTH